MELWETADLLEVTWAPSDLPDGFWLRFFPHTFTSEKEEIYFDDIQPEDRRLAPFVSPNVAGRVMESRGSTVSSFKPAYLKPKHIIDPSKALTRRRGEPIASIGPGTLSLQDRYDAWVAQGVTDERNMIERRWDWMGAQAIQFGQVTVVGEDYPSRTINFNRDPSLTLLQSGAGAWDQNTSDPLADLQAMINLSFPLGRAPITDFVFGSTAWELFSHKDEVQLLLSNQKRGSDTNFNNALTNGAPYQLMGTVSGPGGAGLVNLWVYANWYEDENKQIVQFMDPTDVIGAGNAVNGVQAFGAIMDAKGLKAVPIFPKNYIQEEPSRTITLSQSAPLMVPININNTFRIRVK